MASVAPPLIVKLVSPLEVSLVVTFCHAEVWLLKKMYYHLYDSHLIILEFTRYQDQF